MNTNDLKICYYQSRKGGWFSRLARACTRWAWKGHVRDPINRMFERGLIDSYTYHEAHDYATRLIYGTRVPEIKESDVLTRAALALSITALLFTGCTTLQTARFHAWEHDPNTAQALNSVVNATNAYLSGNTVGAAVDGVSAAAALVRSLEATRAAGDPEMAKAAALSAGASPQVAAIVAQGIAQATASGKAPSAANESVALSLDQAAAKFYP